MSTLEEMKQQLFCYQKDLESMKPLANHYFEIADLENAIWTLQQRIRKAELLEVAKKVNEDIEKSLQRIKVTRIKVTGFYDTKEQGDK